jgi:hypothetical protein
MEFSQMMMEVLGIEVELLEVKMIYLYDGNLV